MTYSFTSIKLRFSDQKCTSNLLSLGSPGLSWGCLGALWGSLGAPSGSLGLSPLPKPIPGPTPQPPPPGHIIAGPTAPQTSNQTLLRKTSPSMHRTGEAPPLHRLRKRPPRRCIAHRGGTAIRLRQRPGTYTHTYGHMYMHKKPLCIRLVSKALASSLPIRPEK